MAQSMPTTFVDDFDHPKLGPAWVVQPGIGAISLNAHPGFLRYQLDSSTTYDDNALWAYHNFAGSNWILETKVSYSLPTGNGRQLLLRLPLGGVGDRNVNEVRWIRDRDDGCAPGCTRNRIVVEVDDGGARAVENISPEDAADTYTIRFIRNGQDLQVQMSPDGVTFTTVAEHTFATALPPAQAVLLSGADFNSTPGYFDLDYVYVAQGTGYTSLCTLGWQFVRNFGMANGMCTVLDAAQLTEQLGVPNAKADELNAYREMVKAAQQDGFVSAEHAATLLRWVNAL
jgi:hypothetical protein